MAVLSIREYEHIAAVANGTVMVGQEPAVAKQFVAIGGVSAPSVAFSARTRFVRLNCDVKCDVEFAASGTPVAVAGNGTMTAGSTEYFGVTPGGKVAVITS